jgi:hypothetical protein
MLWKPSGFNFGGKNSKELTCSAGILLVFRMAKASSAVAQVVRLHLDFPDVTITAIIWLRYI